MANGIEIRCRFLSQSDKIHIPPGRLKSYYFFFKRTHSIYTMFLLQLLKTHLPRDFSLLPNPSANFSLSLVADQLDTTLLGRSVKLLWLLTRRWKFRWGLFKAQ